MYELRVMAAAPPGASSCGHRVSALRGHHRASGGPVGPPLARRPRERRSTLGAEFVIRAPATRPSRRSSAGRRSARSSSRSSGSACAVPTSGGFTGRWPTPPLGPARYPPDRPEWAPPGRRARREVVPRIGRRDRRHDAWLRRRRRRLGRSGLPGGPGGDRAAGGGPGAWPNGRRPGVGAGDRRRTRSTTSAGALVEPRAGARAVLAVTPAGRAGPRPRGRRDGPAGRPVRPLARRRTSSGRSRRRSTPPPSASCRPLTSATPGPFDVIDATNDPTRAASRSDRREPAGRWP
jgi:hypothetical protein